jgi:hypothetical protein
MFIFVFLFRRKLDRDLPSVVENNIDLAIDQLYDGITN